MSSINIKNGYSSKVTAGLDFKLPGSNEKLFNNRGEVNANTNKELMQKTLSFIESLSKGEVQREESIEAKELQVQANKQLVQAFKSGDSAQFKTVAANMMAIVKEYADREGFMRRFLKQVSIEMGYYPRLSLLKKTLFAYQYDPAGANIYAQPVRDAKIMPQEFDIAISTFIPQIELYQSSTNFFEEKLAEMKEAVMVQEDKRWLALANATIGQANGGNDLQIFSSGFTPSVVAKMRSLLDDSGVPPQTMLISADLLQYVPTFGQGIDIFHQYDLISQGKFGNILGLETYIDATRTSTQRVLSKGEVYIISQPEYHGVYTDREGLVLTDTMPMQAMNGKHGKGWVGVETLSMAIANPRSIAKGLVQ